MVPPPGMASMALRATWKSASASAETCTSMRADVRVVVALDDDARARAPDGALEREVEHRGHVGGLEHALGGHGEAAKTVDGPLDAREPAVAPQQGALARG